MSAFKDADSPLDFIRANLKGPVNAEAAKLPADVIAQVEANRNQAAPAPEAPAPVEKAAEPIAEPVVAPTAEVETKETEPTALEAFVDAKTGEEEVKPSKEENFKTLRKKVSEVTSSLHEKEKTLEELQTKLKKYETGGEVPEPVANILKEKEARLAHLEKYEKLHALKLSPAYKERFVKPLVGVKNRLGEIIADYGLPKEVVDRAINTTNRRDLNTFLSEHFDEVGALEVKQLVGQAQAIVTEAKAAEAEPAKALEAIELDFKNIQEARKAQALNAIAEVSKDTWIDSLVKIREEGKIPELIAKEEDQEHNKKYVEPILNQASGEYGKLIKMLADNGLEKLPKDLGYALARMVQLAHASAISMHARAEAEKEAQELKTNSERHTKYARPAIGGGVVGGGGIPSSKTTTPSEAADMLISRVQRR